MINILINTPQTSGKGGVANYYAGLKPYLKNNVKYHTIGSRYICGRYIAITGVLLFPYDLLSYIIKIVIFKPDIIILNPSFIQKAWKRDKIYLNIANIFKKKTIVFIRGWDSKYEAKSDKREIL